MSSQLKTCDLRLLIIAYEKCNLVNSKYIIGGRYVHRLGMLYVAVFCLSCLTCNLTSKCPKQKDKVNHFGNLLLYLVGDKRMRGCVTETSLIVVSAGAGRGAAHGQRSPQAAPTPQSSRSRRRDVSRGGSRRAVLSSVVSVLGGAVQVSPVTQCNTILLMGLHHGTSNLNVSKNIIEFVFATDLASYV